MRINKVKNMMKASFANRNLKKEKLLQFQLGKNKAPESPDADESN